MNRYLKLGVIAEGIKNGQVQTIVVPSNFNALMMGK
jgi:hypothetical protein